MDAISWYALGRTVNDATTIMEEIDTKILTHNLDGSAHGQSNEAVYNHRITALLDHVSYSIYNVKVNPAARIYKAIVGPGFEADFSTIQAAVDWANLYGGGIVHIKAGTYVQTDDLQLYSNILLQGEDMDLTILDFADEAYHIQAIGTSGTHKRNIEIRDFQIKRSAVSDEGAIHLVYCDDVDIHRVKITDCDLVVSPQQYAIDADYCTRLRITENQITSSAQGIALYHTNQVFMEFNYFNEIGDLVLIYNLAPSTIFRHNYLDTNGDVDADSMVYIGTNSDNSVFDSNFFLNCRVMALWTANGSRISVTNNVFTKTGYAASAIALNDADRCIIAQNRIYGFDQDGVIFTSNVDRSICSNNVITNCGGWGIVITEATSIDNAIIGNVVYGNALGGVSDGGTGDEVAHNVT
jgi:hypothetical protein